MQLKKRTLLLGTSLTAFGALLTGAAFSGPTGTAQTGPSAAVGVAQLQGLNVELRNEVQQIAADGNYHIVADIYASSMDPNYDLKLTHLMVDESGVTTTGQCADPDYALTSDGADDIIVDVPLPMPNGNGNGNGDDNGNGDESLNGLQTAFQNANANAIENAPPFAQFQVENGDDNGNGNGDAAIDTGARLYLSLQAEGTESDCFMSGAVVTATFEAIVGGNGDDNGSDNGNGDDNGSDNGNGDDNGSDNGNGDDNGSDNGNGDDNGSDNGDDDDNGSDNDDDSDEDDLES